MIKLGVNEDAVSPVIGAILMVAITVVLAAVIASYAFEMTENIPDQKDIYVITKMGLIRSGDSEGTGENAIIMTIMGGKDVGALTNITYKGGYSSEFGQLISPGGNFKEPLKPPFEIGDSGYIIFGTESDKNGNWDPNIIIRGEFADGSVKILTKKVLAKAPG